MPNVLNYETGHPESLEGADYTQALLSGRYGVRANETVAVVSPEGQYLRIPSTEAAEAFSHGWLHESAEAEHARKTQDKYGSTGQGVLAGLAGAARGASLGLSDQMLTKSGLVAPETLQGLREANPIASTVSEIGGAGVGLLAPGGVLAKGGALAAKGAGLALAEGAAAGLGRKALGSAIEGALYGGGELLTEDALGETDFTGQALLSHMGAGALLGGVAGAAFGVVPKVVESGAGFVGEQVGKMIPGASAKEKTANFLRDFSETRAVKAASGQNKAAYRAITHNGDEVQNINILGRDLLDHGIVSAENSTTDKILLAAREAKEAQGVRKGEIMDILDAAPAEKVPYSERLTTGRLADHIEDEVLAPLLKKTSAGYDPVISRVKAEVAKLREKGAEGQAWAKQLPLRDAEALKSEYDPFLKLGSGETTQMQQALHGIRRVIKESVETDVERIAAKVDPKLATEFREAKRLYGSFAKAEEMAQTKAVGEQSNRWVSPSDYGVGIAAASGVGGLSALPLALAHKVVRERGSAITADMANRAAKLAKMERAVNATKNAIEDSVDALLSPKRIEHLTSYLSAPSAVFSGFSIAGAPHYQARANDQVEPATPLRKQRKFDEQMASLASDPAKLHAQITASLTGIEGVAPKNALVIATTATRIVNYLSAKVPKDPNPMTGIRSIGVPAWEPSDSDMHSYARTVEAALEPMSVIKSLGTGSASPEGLATIKEIYPALYQQTVKSIIARLTAKNAPALNYDARLTLSELLASPLDPMVTPVVIAALQSGYAPVQQSFSPQWSPAQVTKGGMSLATASQTHVQKLEA